MLIVKMLLATSRVIVYILFHKNYASGNAVPIHPPPKRFTHMKRMQEGLGFGKGGILHGYTKNRQKIGMYSSVKRG